MRSITCSGVPASARAAICSGVMPHAVASARAGRVPAPASASMIDVAEPRPLDGVERAILGGAVRAQDLDLPRRAPRASPEQFQMSAWRATRRRRTFSPPPPIRIGGCGRLHRSRLAPGVAQPVEAAVERRAVRGPQELLHAGATRRAARAVSARRGSRSRSPRTRPRTSRRRSVDQPAVRQHVDGRRHLREQRGVPVASCR